MHRNSPILCMVTSMMHEISGQNLPVPQLGVTIVRLHYSRIRRRRSSFGRAFSGGWVLGEHIGLAERSGSETQAPCETSRYGWRPPLLNEQLALVAEPHSAEHTLGARKVCSACSRGTSYFPNSPLTVQTGFFLKEISAIVCVCRRCYNGKAMWLPLLRSQHLGLGPRESMVVETLRTLWFSLTCEGAFV